MRHLNHHLPELPYKQSSRPPPDTSHRITVPSGANSSPEEFQPTVLAAVSAFQGLSRTWNEVSKSCLDLKEEIETEGVKWQAELVKDFDPDVEPGCRETEKLDVEFNEKIEFLEMPGGWQDFEPDEPLGKVGMRDESLRLTWHRRS
jgi:hypothetical protein